MTPSLSREARIRAELATRDAVFRLALRRADLLEGFHKRESLCERVSERHQLIALRCGWLVRNEREAERLCGASGYRSVQETTTGGSLKGCGWEDEEWTY